MASPKMKRNLTSRHISMIAIGGCIGTGIFMASGAVVSTAGSYGTLLSYVVLGLVIYFLMSAVAELATFYPVSGSFVAYSQRFIDPSLSFAIGWLYSFMWILIASIDVITIAKILQFWEFFRNYSTFVLCLVILAVLYLINLASVALFGEIEFWLTIIKVLTVIVFLVVGFSVLLGIGSDAKGLTTFIENGNNGAGILGIFGVLSTVAFSFGGAEAVALTAGESDNPAKTMPKAVNQVFWQVLILYIGTMFIISAIVSATDSRLLDSSSVTASPFTIVFENVGLAAAAIVMNVVILTSVLSAGNSALYLSSRQLYSLSESGYAPKVLGKLNKNSSPMFALNVSVVCVIGVLIFEKVNKNAYYTLLSMAGVVTIIIWIIAVVSHIRLRKAIAVQGADEKQLLPYRAKFGTAGSYISLVVFIALFVLQVYADVSALQKSSAAWVNVIADLLTPTIMLVLYFAYKSKVGAKVVALKDMDISSYNMEDEHK